jgi:D-alanine-D-alanine ligase
MLRVGVFFGGCSSEKEISLESGRHIYNSLDRDKYEVLPIFVDSSLRFWEVPERLVWMNATADVEKCLDQEAVRILMEDLPQQIDFCMLGLHGKYVEDGALQGLLELLGLPYNGPRILGSAIGMDKEFQKHLIRAAGLKCARNVVVDDRSYALHAKAIEQQIEEEIGFPCIVKPVHEGCSTGLAKVNDRSALPEAIRQALKWDNRVLAEEFLNLMEVTCTVLGNEKPAALLPTETPSKGDFLTVEEKFLPGDAQMITPPRVPPEDVKTMQEGFVKAYQAMNLEVYARIDGFWDTERKELYINEPNTLPGVTPSTHVFHQAAEAGMSASQFFDCVIKLSLEAHSRAELLAQTATSLFGQAAA